MSNLFIRTFTRSALWLRYRIRVHGLDEIAARGASGILFLPNHPALIDPIILMTVLNRSFAPRALADEHQIDRFFIRNLARRVRALPAPSVADSPAARDAISRALDDLIDALRQGQNVLLYPSGHLYESRWEDLRGNSAAHTILQAIPDVRVVLVRTRGLWGSRFSRAWGNMPDVAAVLKKGAVQLLSSGIFFAPRRRVDVEFFEPPDLPRHASRQTLNRYLESFYNQDARPARYVPYTIWERQAEREIPEPAAPIRQADLSAVPESTRNMVLDYLRELCGVEDIKPGDHLARDLGLDSLARVDVLTWLQGQFGQAAAHAESLQRVSDVMLAAAGEAVIAGPADVKPPPAKWFGKLIPEPAALPGGETVLECFLRQARRGPGRPAVADQISGVRTYRDLVLAMLTLRPALRKIQGRYVGIMLPASVAAAATYMSALAAGKTAVMVNWTLGRRNVKHGLDLLGVKAVVTSKSLVERLRSEGIDLSGLEQRFVFLEDVRAGLGLWAKLSAAARAWLSWRSLRSAAVADQAAVLFTSGSEREPKAVPLSHANLLANIRDVAAAVTVRSDDKLLGILPPFHSFGLTVSTLLPLCMGVRVVFHPNPNDAAVLARIIAEYAATLLVGTPTFLGGICRAAGDQQLSPLRLAVTGAEKCPPRVYRALADKAPNATVLEGYGVTECSPVVSVNDERRPVPQTIGKPLPSLECAIVNVETGRRAATGEPGMLLVRGPSVFDGYLSYDGPSPFVEFEGKRWYRTGDLVSQDEQGVLTFAGRLKRFVKIGGEMISLSAIEAALEEHYAAPPGEPPAVAVVAGGTEEHPELVLFCAVPADRQTVNAHIRQAGLSGLHNIRKVVQINEIPVLGTGKTDYRALERMLADRP